MARAYVYGRSQEEKRKMNSERQKRYRKNNLPRIQVKQHTYYVENCERIKAQQKAYRDANRRLLVIRYYFRYYGKKGWSKEDIKKIIKQKLNINAEDYGKHSNELQE